MERSPSTPSGPGRRLMARMGQDPQGPLSPTAGELFRIFERSLLEFAGLPSEPIGEPVEGPAVMTLERGMRLPERVRGFLVLRAHRHFGAMLLEKKTDWSREPLSREAVFDQLAQEFSEKLVSAFWNVKGAEFPDPALCNPLFWPARRPTAACAVLVETCPLEIRLWMDGDLVWVDEADGTV